MKLITLLHKLTLPLLLMASLGACSRYIEGDVFLDKNANNVKDHDEPAIAGMPFTVTRDEATLQTAETDSDGHFLVATSINDVDVNFCVKVRAEDVSAFQAADPETPKALKALEASPEASSEACPLIVGKPDCNNKNCCDNALCADAEVCEEEEDSCSKKSDGKPDCSDPDCCDDSACSEDSACEEEDEDACPKDKSGNPDCDDSRCSAEAACNTYSVQPMQACDKTKASQLKMRLNVPVAVDYATRVGQLNEVRTGPVAVGDKFGIEITYPSSCSFEPYALPKAFAPIGLGKAFDAATRELRLGEAILAQPSQVIRQDAPPFGHDKLHTYVLRLEVIGEEGQKDGEIKIQPTVSCPDGKKIPASANVVTFSSAPPAAAFSLDAGLVPGCPELGEIATLKTMIEAQDPATYAAATYTVFLGGESHLTIDSMPSQCQDKGTSIECAMDTLHLGAKSEFSIKFKMAESVADPTTVSFTSQIEADGVQVTDAAILCSYP